MSSQRSTGSKVVWGLVVLMAIIHWDFWFWDSTTLVFGFMPIGLLFHLLYSLAAACLWAAALKFCWPAELEAWAEEGAEDGSSSGAAS